MKPENILLHANGKVSLSDFGVAKLLPDIEACRSTSGTHGYMVSMMKLQNAIQVHLPISQL
ncbi:hypothetical protein EON63_08450 [archaeon]|nr:MAG: hypothetical protein EON63_08450 [archaeon]